MAAMDVEPPGETDRAVYDEKLAMVAQVEMGEPARQTCRQEALHLDPDGLEAEVDARVDTAGVIDQDAHVDSARTSPACGHDELSSRLRVVEDVTHQPDRARGAVHGREHRGVSRVTVFERLDPIAGDERLR